MTVENMATFAGVLLSLALTFIPGLAEWYGSLGGREKSLFYIFLVVLGTGLVALRACTGLGVSFIPEMACGDPVSFINIFIDTVIAGTATYVATKKLK